MEQLRILSEDALASFSPVVVDCGQSSGTNKCTRAEETLREREMQEDAVRGFDFGYLAVGAELFRQYLRVELSKPCRQPFIIPSGLALSQGSRLVGTLRMDLAYLPPVGPVFPGVCQLLPMLCEELQFHGGNPHWPYPEDPRALSLDHQSPNVFQGDQGAVNTCCRAVCAALLEGMAKGPCFPPDHHLGQKAGGRPQEMPSTHLLARPEGMALSQGSRTPFGV
ncbi:hypothetical protein MHYP_G00020820 [Metynnis hypsauchen]